MSAPLVEPSTTRTGWAVWIPSGLVAAYYATPVPFIVSQPAVVSALVVPALVSLGALIGRRTRPRVVTLVTLLCLLISPVALGGVLGALASRARHARHVRDLPEVVTWALVAVGVKVVALLVSPVSAPWSPTSWVELTISGSLIGFAVLIGLVVRSTGESRASAAMAEQARANEVRLQERVRIAREMHDVVAHRISLVAMTSGALAHRADLPDDARTVVSTIQSNARLALDELRGLLSDLRDEGASGMGEQQPSLELAPVLIAEARETGDVAMTCDVDPVEVPAGPSRHLYRILQEALTNARKHAPGQPVAVRLGREGEDLLLEVRNAVPPEGGQPAADRLVPGSGYGLVGIQERARLLGGQATTDIGDGEAVVLVRVPATVTT